MINDIKEFDDNFPDGVYVIPGEDKVKIRELYEYCKEKGVSSGDLTKEEMNRFIVNKNQ